MNRSAYTEGGVYSEMEPGARAARVSQDLYTELSQRKGEDHALQQVCPLVLFFLSDCCTNSCCYPILLVIFFRVWRLDSCCQ